MEAIAKREAWNKGKFVSQKPPLKPKDIWVIRIRLQNAHAVRDLAMFNLAIDSKLRGCDLVNARTAGLAEVLTFATRQVSGYSSRSGGSYPARGNFRSWPGVHVRQVQQIAVICY